MNSGLDILRLLRKKKHLEEFLKTLRKPDEKCKDELKAYEEVVSGVKSKIFTLFSSSLKMKKSVEEIAYRLASPEYKNNIALVTHQILQANVHARQMFNQTRTLQIFSPRVLFEVFRTQGAL